MLPLRLLRLELTRQGAWQLYKKAESFAMKFMKNIHRCNFLQQCNQNALIPKFLHHKLPKFKTKLDERQIKTHQISLLKKELTLATTDRMKVEEKMVKLLHELNRSAPEKLLPTIDFHIRQSMREISEEKRETRKRKLHSLSTQQDRPPLQVKDTVRCLDDIKVPTYIMNLLKLGPRHPILRAFNETRLLVETEKTLFALKKNNLMKENTTSDISLSVKLYAKKAKSHTSKRALSTLKRWLEENDIKAVPFDKGLGFCLMRTETYNKKLEELLDGPQFEKVTTKRKNAIDPFIKESREFKEKLTKLHKDGKISQEILNKAQCKGGSPARIYGLAKIHKTAIPLRPILSMPGSIYHPLANLLLEWIKGLPSTQTDCNSKQVSQTLATQKLKSTETLMSLDVVSLYTNVPLDEAVQIVAEDIYNETNTTPPVDKPTFIELMRMATKNVLFLSPNGSYRQIDGVAMGSPLGPALANAFVSHYENKLIKDLKHYSRYIDDCLLLTEMTEIETVFNSFNSLHPSLKFTKEEMSQGKIAFLDILIERDNEQLTTRWYRKPTDTGLTLNYLADSPMSYKQSTIIGTIHRLWNICSSKDLFEEDLKIAKNIWKNNQYPEKLIKKLVEKTVNKLESQNSQAPKQEEPEKVIMKVQYRGEISRTFQQKIQREHPIKVVFTTDKLKQVCNLKAPTPPICSTNVVYKIHCETCTSSYIGQTARMWKERMDEHKRRGGIIYNHTLECNAAIKEEIIYKAQTSFEAQIAEAVAIKQHKPSLNSKDEFRHDLLVRL